MTRYYQDFVGLNTFIYEPVGWTEDLTYETGSGVATSRLGGQNYIGWSLNDAISLSPPPPNHIASIGNYKNFKFPLSLPTTASFFNALMSHRGNVYGYPTWRQIRVSNNPLTRRQRKNNIFTYVQEPGEFINKRPARYGAINVFTEPVVMDSNKPLSLVGDVSVYNEKLDIYQNRAVELRTSFGNETSFFANKEINEYFDTDLETDDNYEQLKELYLDGGLEDDGSPIDSFNLLVYRQSVFPKQQYSYLNRTRSRTFFVNNFWREEREDRTETEVETGFGTTVPSQSMWPLDVSEDWATKAEPADISEQPVATVFLYNYYIGGFHGTTEAYLDSSGSPLTETASGFNTGDDVLQNTTDTSGASGILMNSYSQFTRGHYDSTTGNPAFGLTTGYSGEINQYLTSSAFYSRRHAMNSIYSVVGPSGMPIAETGSLTSISTGSLFEGMAAWDCGRLANKKPFYETYSKFAEETRVKGQGFSIVPEFRISNHVDAYLTQGATEELREIFELSGGLSTNSTTENEDSFYEILSTSDFLKHFDLIKKDHKDFASEKILTLKCKAVKKFLPYDGFYPAEQTVDLAREFYNSIKDDVALIYDNAAVGNGEDSIQGILEPLFAPGVLFNTIKSGVAVDYPIVLPTDNPFFVEVDYEGRQYDTVALSGRVGLHNYMLAGSDLAPQDEIAFNDLRSIWSKRIDFESLVEPEKTIEQPRTFHTGSPSFWPKRSRRSFL